MDYSFTLTWKLTTSLYEAVEATKVVEKLGGTATPAPPLTIRP